MTTLESFRYINESGLCRTPVEENKQEPVLAKACTLIINSGNIVSVDWLRQRASLEPKEEVNEVLSNTLANWLNKVDKSKIKENKIVDCRNPDFNEKLSDSEKNEISISVKIFLNTLDVDVLNKAISTILEEIGADRIDTLILSLPDKVFNQDHLPKELIMPLWLAVQKNIENKRVLKAGFADFNTSYLNELIDHLEDKSKTPAINQVNLTSCCKMPEDLVELSKTHNIKLITHIDPKEIFTIENLHENIRKHMHEYDAQGWMHTWIARCTLIMRGRGIVKYKGYILNAQRELNYSFNK